MPCHKIEVTEYQCAKCWYRWINWQNGKEGPKPKRCSRCKRRDWEEGYLSSGEKQLRRNLLNIEKNQVKYSTVFGAAFFPIPTNICANFLSICPRPTEYELRVVLNPVCYLGPYDHSQRPHTHKGTCSDQAECCPGWIRKSGCYDYDKKIYESMVRKEKEVRHHLMQHIIDSRNGFMHTNSTHYQYFEDRMKRAKLLSSEEHGLDEYLFG
jgi:predicted metal-binding protein